MAMTTEAIKMATMTKAKTEKSVKTNIKDNVEQILKKYEEEEKQ